MAAIKKILKIGEDQILPITKMDCVVCEDGKLLDQVLAAMKTDIQVQGNSLKDYVLGSKFQEELAKVNEKIADDIATESALRVAEEKRIENKIDAEVTKAREEEGKLDLRIKAFEEGNGSVAKQIEAAKTELNTAIEAAEGRAKADAKKAQGEVDALEIVVGNANSGLVKQVNTLEADHAAIRGEITTAKDGLQNQIDAINSGENGILATAKAYADAQDTAVKTILGQVDAAIRSEFAAADTTLKTELQDEIDADVKEEADRAKDAEAELLGKINKEASDRAAAVSGVQGALDDAVEALEGEDAKLAKAITDEADRAKGVENGFETRIAAAEGFVAAQPAKDEAQNQRLADLEKMMGLGGEGTEGSALDKIREDVSTAQSAAGKAQEGVDALEIEVADVRNDFAAADVAVQEALQAEIDKKVAQADYDVKVKALDDKDAELLQAINDEAGRADAAEKGLQAAIDAINHEETGIYAKAVAHVAEEIGKVNNTAGNLEGKVEANEQAIAVINGTGEGSIAKAVADLVNGAPEAANTLKELADSIAANQGVYEGWVAAHEVSMANMKKDLQDEIDADVKVEADRAVARENAIENAYKAADGELQTAINTEKERAMAAEDVNAKAIAAEKQRAEGIEGGLAGRLDVIEGDGEGSVAKALADAKKYADDKNLAMDGRVDALETFKNEAAEKHITCDNVPDGFNFASLLG